MLRKIGLSILSAFLLALPYINGKLWIFAWIAFIPLFSILNGISKTKAFFLSFAAGIAFWSITIYWLVHVTLLGTIVLILYLALYFGLFGLLISICELRVASYELFFIPSLWVLLEYIRSHLFTGFPWALLAYSQYQNLPIIQISDITGAWGVSFLAMMVNVMVYYLVIKSQSHKVTSKIKFFLLPALCFLVISSYGFYRIYVQPATCDIQQVRISVIQGNIPQELKWDPFAKDYILNKYEQLTKQASNEDTDLIVWPEAASPGLLGEDTLVFKQIFSLAKNIKTPLLTGAVSNDTGEFFNSALLINSKGEISGRYDKLHLVPFGEYIPLKKYLPFLETVVPIGDISKGKEYTIFQIPDKFAVLICFEDLFPELSRQFIKRGARFLINITNDAWYKETSAPYQHLQASVFRAVENRVFLVRAANTGVSGFINSSGKIISSVRDKSGKEIVVDGVDTEKIVIPKRGLTFYNRFGDYWVLLCILFILLSLKYSPSKN
jgi:apolipoprotein N-acyltransferase